MLLYLCTNNLENETEAFGKHARSLDINPLPFQDTKPLEENCARMLNEKTKGKKYPDYSDWISLAYPVICLYKTRKQFRKQKSSHILPVIRSGFRITANGFDKKRVADTLHKVLGPRLNFDSMCKAHNSCLHARFYSILRNSFEENGYWIKPVLKPDKPQRRLVGMEKMVWKNSQSIGAIMKTFFDHCPFCLSPKIEVTTFSTENQRSCEGFAGWEAVCSSCHTLLHFEICILS